MPHVGDLPLDQLRLNVSADDGSKTDQVAALDKRWAQKRSWAVFVPFTRGHSTMTGARDRLVTAAQELSLDLQWLLGLPHHCFWSQLVFDPGARSMLLSYLERAPRCYDQELLELSEEEKQAIAGVHGLIFKVYLRLLTPKESNTCFLLPESHGQLLYDKYLLDVPVLLDLCSLFGYGSSSKILFQHLNQVLKVQPKYADDISSTAQMITKALKEVEAHVVTETDGGVAVALKNMAPGSKGELAHSQLEDLVLFTLDTVSSVALLLQLVPTAAPALHVTNIEPQLAHFYEMVIPQMYTLVSSVSKDAQRRVDGLRYHLLEVAKYTLGTRVSSIVKKTDQSEVSILAEEYLAVLAECLAEPNFIRDFNFLCPVEKDLSTLKQKCPEVLDGAKHNFLLQSVFSCLDIPRRSSSSKTAPPTTSRYSTNDDEPSCSGINGHSVQEGNPEDLVLESLVSEIQSILPDLGSGFLQKCLRHYEFNKERVVNAILEESLPDELKKLDRTMPLPGPSKEEVVPAMPVRLNVFDHDEFDVMSRDHIDTSRVHKGKRKSKHKNLAQLLDDKAELKDLKDTYARYSTVPEVVYDDEYDDTYDEVNDVSVDTADPLTERRPFVTPRVLAQRDDVPNEEEEEDEFEEEGAVGGAPADNFVQDPAVLRAQAEQRRATKMAQQRPHNQPQPNRDVVGRPKGQGQDANVVINRQKKNTHKSSQANHNRRAGAQRKMRGGMIPS